MVGFVGCSRSLFWVCHDRISNNDGKPTFRTIAESRTSQDAQNGNARSFGLIAPNPKICRRTVRVLRRPVIRPDVQLLRLAIVAEGGD